MTKRPEEGDHGSSDVEQAPSRPQKLRRLAENPLSFPREPSDTIQITTWNLKSLRAEKELATGRPFRKYIEAENAHIVCLTETRASDNKLPFDEEPAWDFLKGRYPYRYWRGKVAMLSKFEPVSVVYGFPDGQQYDQQEASERVITLEFQNTIVIGTYVQNSGKMYSHIHLRQQFNQDFTPYLRSLDARKQVVWCGDFNVVTPDSTGQRSDDLEKSPIAWGKHGGTHPTETNDHIASLGPQPQLMDPRRPGRRFVDIWRIIHPNDRQYTHNSGIAGKWRIDGFICSERFLWRVRKCEIREEVNDKLLKPAEGIYRKASYSDHWPCWLSLEMEESEF